MLSQEIIVSCVDRARSLDEQASSKDPKFYKRNFLANVFGAYLSPYYPKPNSIRGVEDLWVRFKPRLATSKQSADLLFAWVKLINKDYPLTSELVSKKVEIIRARHAGEGADGRSNGFNYQFVDPFILVAREIDSGIFLPPSYFMEEDKEVSFTSNILAFEYAVDFCSGSAFDGAVVTALIESIKDFGSVFVLKVKLALDGTVREDYLTVDDAKNLDVGSLIAVICGVEAEKLTLVPVAVLEPLYNPLNGWKIKHKIHG